MLAAGTGDANEYCYMLLPLETRASFSSAIMGLVRA